MERNILGSVRSELDKEKARVAKAPKRDPSLVDLIGKGEDGLTQPGLSSEVFAKEVMGILQKVSGDVMSGEQRTRLDNILLIVEELLKSDKPDWKKYIMAERLITKFTFDAVFESGSPVAAIMSGTKLGYPAELEDGPGYVLTPHNIQAWATLMKMTIMLCEPIMRHKVYKIRAEKYKMDLEKWDGMGDAPPIPNEDNIVISWRYIRENEPTMWFYFVSSCINILSRSHRMFDEAMITRQVAGSQHPVTGPGGDEGIRKGLSDMNKLMVNLKKRVEGAEIIDIEATPVGESSAEI